LNLFTRLYRDARSTKHKTSQGLFPLSQILITNSTFSQLLFALVFFNIGENGKKSLRMLAILLTQLWSVTSHKHQVLTQHIHVL